MYASLPRNTIISGDGYQITGQEGLATPDQKYSNDASSVLLPHRLCGRNLMAHKCLNRSDLHTVAERTTNTCSSGEKTYLLGADGYLTREGQSPLDLRYFGSTK